MNIGIDIDNVIANTFVDLSGFFARFMRCETSTQDIVQVMRKRKYLMFIYFMKAWAQRVMTTVSLIDGAAETIETWHKKHRIYLVTSRIRIFNRQTKFWLKKNNILYHELHHAKETTKHKKVADCHLFIEDSIDEAHVLADHAKKVFLFDQPWNRQPIKKPNITRVSSWQEISQNI